MKTSVMVINLIAPLFSLWCMGQSVETRSVANEQIGVPRASKIKRKLTIHGDTRIDNYYWMLTYPGEAHSPRFLNYVNAENTYTEKRTASLRGLRTKLFEEMKSRTADSDLSIPTKFGDYLYYSKTETGKEYPKILRRHSQGGPEQLLLDTNELAKGHGYYDLTYYEVSRDQNLLFYSENYAAGKNAIFVKNLSSGETKSLGVKDLSGSDWTLATDGSGLYFATQDSAQRPNRVHFLNFTDDSSTLVFEETDPIFELGSVHKSHDGKYLFINTGSKSTTETLIIDLESESLKPRIFSNRKAGHHYSLEHRDGWFYILSDKEGPNFGLYRTTISQSESKYWEMLQMPTTTKFLDSIYMFKEFMVLFLRDNGLTKLEVYNFNNQSTSTISFDEAVHELSIPNNVNLEYDTDQIRFSYTSFLVPSRLYSYDVKTDTKEVIKDTPVGDTFHPSNYATKRFLVMTRDGTKVPVSMVYKKGLKLGSASPLFLNAYGNYGSPFFFDWPHSYSVATITPLLDRGVIYAAAHIRGGGELGPPWYNDGKLKNKLNTFYDFIDVTEWLIQNKYTSADKLGVRSVSAGGLLLGYIINNRPELYKAVIAHAPFVDLLTTMLDEKIPLTTQEWEEWGNPNVKEDYFYMKRYCPVSNVREQGHPNILVKASLNDTQVMPHEPVKWVAKMRDLKTDSNEILLSVNMKGGHGGDSGRFSQLEEVSFDLAWLLSKIAK